MRRPTTAALAMIEAIRADDDAIPDDARDASAVAPEQASRWLDEGMAAPLAGHPLLSFEAARRGTPERVVVHVDDETGDLAIAIARRSPAGQWERHMDIRIAGRDMTSLIRTLALGTGPRAAAVIAVGQRIATSAANAR